MVPLMNEAFGRFPKHKTFFASSREAKPVDDVWTTPTRLLRDLYVTNVALQMSKVSMFIWQSLFKSCVKAWNQNQSMTATKRRRIDCKAVLARLRRDSLAILARLRRDFHAFPLVVDALKVCKFPLCIVYKFGNLLKNSLAW